MMRSWAYNRLGVLMGTSWSVSCPHWHGLRDNSLPMITPFLSQGGFCATAKPCFEDKIVQRAVVMILEAIFEPDFHTFSHGFRKGHSQHQALHELREQCRKLNITWIVDADVSGFFDTLDWGHLRAFIQQRVKDGVILRLIG